MKKISSFKYFLLMLLNVVYVGILQAQNFKLIDINTTKNSDPYNYQYSTKNMFAELNGTFYFNANDGVNGSELFASDGTAGGTRLVSDINPGPASSYPFDIVTLGNKLFFAAYISNGQQTLFVSDGTSGGTQAIDALPQGTYYSYLQYLTDVNGILYFIYNYGDAGGNFTQLWRSDGTSTGTSVVANFYGSLSQLTNVNGRLFFVLYNYNDAVGQELYTSDGTDAGTFLVSDINPNFYTGSNPTHLTAVKDLLYFAADDGTGNRLWVSDGTGGGTHPVRNANITLAPGDTYQTDPFAMRNNTLFFQGYAVNPATMLSTGNELCKYNTSDTTFHQVTLVKDIVPGEQNSYPSFITNVNGTLFFTIGPDNADAQLWKSDGTRAGTVLVKDINPGGVNNYYGLTNVDGSLWFAYGNNALGTELWKSDGTDAGTVLIRDILPGNGSSYPGYFTYENNIFIFSANGVKGRELWRSDGTQAGTVMIKNINSIATGSSDPSGFARLTKGKTVFSAYDGRSATNVFVTDGNSAKPWKPAPYVAGIYTNSGVKQFFRVQNLTYFFDGSFQLWSTDGTNAGTKRLDLPSFGYVGDVAATDDLLYIFSYDYNTGLSVMWRTDGTASGTFILKSDILSLYNTNSTAVGNTLFFGSTNPSDYSSGLWKTDGTVDGTVLLQNTLNSSPSSLHSFSGKLYFSAYSPGNSFGPSLWTSDGTAAGTKVVKDVAVVSQLFAEANGKLFFYALDRISLGYELFVSDGTTGGTKLLKDINKGGASSQTYVYPTSLVSGDTLLYFIADDGNNGPELWKSNGTSAGTKLVKNITPGIEGTYFQNLVNINNHLFFTINDVLWQSDGSKANTHPVKDDNLTGVSQFRYLTGIGDSLYFSAYTLTTGQELYVGSADINSAPLVTLSIPDSFVKYSTPTNIKLNALATDQDGAIGKVEFYNGATLLHTEKAAPYGFLMQNVPVGTYTFTARAYDDKGLETTSNKIKVEVVADNVPPIVSIVNPSNNAGYPGITDIRIVAEAKDANDKIASVEFYNGTTLIQKENLYPYAFTWINVQPGTYVLTAKATDAKGLSATSTAVTFTVGSPTVPLTTNRSPLESTGDRGEILALKLSPNPAHGILQVYTTGMMNTSASIDIISSAGVVIKTFRQAGLNNGLRVDISSLPAGSYFLRVITGDKTIQKKFIKL